MTTLDRVTIPLVLLNSGLVVPTPTNQFYAAAIPGPASSQRVRKYVRLAVRSQIRNDGRYSRTTPPQVRIIAGVAVNVPSLNDVPAYFGSEAIDGGFCNTHGLATAQFDPPLAVTYSEQISVVVADPWLGAIPPTGYALTNGWRAVLTYQDEPAEYA